MGETVAIVAVASGAKGTDGSLLQQGVSDASENVTTHGGFRRGELFTAASYPSRALMPTRERRGRRGCRDGLQRTMLATDTRSWR